MVQTLNDPKVGCHLSNEFVSNFTDWLTWRDFLTHTFTLKITTRFAVGGHPNPTLCPGVLGGVNEKLKGTLSQSENFWSIRDIAPQNTETKLRIHFLHSLPPKNAKNSSLLVILGTQMVSQLAFFWHWQGVTLAYFWHWLGVTLAYFRHSLCITLAWYANMTRNGCQKYANVTPCQCQKNANCDAIWVPSITRRDHFLAFLGGIDAKN